MWSAIASIASKVPWQAIGKQALNVGSQYLGNKLVNEPAAERAYERSLQGMSSAYMLSKEGAEEAFKRSYDAYRMRYQDTMEDMRKAGLNPILAAGSGGFSVGSGINSPAASASNAQSFKADQSNLSYTKSLLETKQAAKEEAQTKNLYQQSRLTYNQANNMLEQIKKTKAEAREAAQRLQNLLQQHAKLVQETMSASLDREQRQMKMRALRGIENDMKPSIKILEYLQSGKPGSVIYNYVESTKNLIKDSFSNAYEKLKTYNNTYGD